MQLIANYLRTDAVRAEAMMAMNEETIMSLHIVQRQVIDEASE